MRLQEIYAMKPKTKEDQLTKKVLEYVSENYPFVKVENLRITKDHVFVKTFHGQIVLQKSEFE